MTGPMIERHANAAASASAGTPRLSVLIPFLRDDPRKLIATLDRQAAPDVEIVLIDDGAPDATLTDTVRAAVDAAATPASLLISRRNLGRSAARNRLSEAARGDWLLFLDADMSLPDDFLQRWRTALTAARADALFGGYTPVQPDDPALAVHAALARASDVHTLAQRRALGAVAVCSSNLAVRRSFFQTCPFDTGFSGWGWEDVDWALSAARSGHLDHADIPAGHDGLQPVEALLDKFAAAGPNFARLLGRHPEYAAQPGARLARALKTTGLGAPARAIGAMLARIGWAPVRLRVLALKLYRGGHAAKAL